MAQYMLLKEDIVNQFINDPNRPASAALAYTLNSNLAIVGDTTGMEFGTGAEKRYIVFKHEDGSRSSLELYNNGITLTRYNPSTDQWEGIWSLPIN